jgi:hypothetical protein
VPAIDQHPTIGAESGRVVVFRAHTLVIVSLRLVLCGRVDAEVWLVGCMGLRWPENASQGGYLASGPWWGREGVREPIHEVMPCTTATLLVLLPCPSQHAGDGCPIDAQLGHQAVHGLGTAMPAVDEIVIQR